MKYLLNYIGQNFKRKFLKLVALFIAFYVCSSAAAIFFFFLLALQSLVNFSLVKPSTVPSPVSNLSSSSLPCSLDLPMAFYFTILTVFNFEHIFKFGLPVIHCDWNVIKPTAFNIKTRVLNVAEITSLILNMKHAYRLLFLNINQLDALNFIISLFQASTCFEHMCSSSGGQNCIIQSLVSAHV